MSHRSPRKSKAAKRRFPEAYEEGMDAYLDGKSLEDNPYQKPTVKIPIRLDKWLWWRRGWFGWC